MDFKQNFKRKVKRILETLPLSNLTVDFDVVQGTRVVPIVTSDDFEYMDEGERQVIVLKKLFDELDPYEQSRIEFVHTMAPSEYQPAHDEP